MLSVLHFISKSNSSIWKNEKKIWKNNCISLKVKMRLYETMIFLTLLCIAVWSITAILMKRLHATHHRWQRSILGISWKDRVTNKEVRVRTGQHSIDDKLGERRHRCLDMWYESTTSAYLERHWEVQGFKRGPGRPWTSWRSTVNKDLLGMGIAWEEAEVAARNRLEWRRSVAQCIHLDECWIKVNIEVLNLHRKDSTFVASYMSDYTDS